MQPPKYALSARGMREKRRHRRRHGGSVVQPKDLVDPFRRGNTDAGAYIASKQCGTTLLQVSHRSIVLPTAEIPTRILASAPSGRLLPRNVRAHARMSAALLCSLAPFRFRLPVCPAPIMEREAGRFRRRDGRPTRSTHLSAALVIHPRLPLPAIRRTHYFLRQAFHVVAAAQAPRPPARERLAQASLRHGHPL